MAARSVSMPVVIGVVVVLALLIGGLAWRYFGPNTGGTAGARPLTAEERANQDWLNQKAKETGGDFDKLGPEDQRRLFAAHGPQAPFVLRQAARPVKVGP